MGYYVDKTSSDENYGIYDVFKDYKNKKEVEAILLIAIVMVIFIAAKTSPFDKQYNT